MANKRRGTNQYQAKFGLTDKTKVRIWFIAFLTVTGAWLSQPKVISPCADNGCSITSPVYAKENLNPEEQLIVECIRMWGFKECDALRKLIFKESGLRPNAVNSSSGACGMFQALPCKKMKCELYDYDCQIKWGLNYIKQRYGTPSKAWAFHQEHNWY